MKHRAFAIFWLGICAVGFGLGVFLAGRQHVKLTRYVPGRAVVLSSDVVVRRRRSTKEGVSITYQPVVRYQYIVHGTMHECDDVFPLDVSRGGRWGRNWARNVAGSFSEKETVDVFYDPYDPGQAFLLKRPGVFPYFFVLISSVLGIVGIAAFAGGASARTKADNRRRAAIAAAAWHVIGGLSAGHYFILAGGDYETFGVMLFAIYAYLGLVPVFWIFPANGIGHRLKAAGFISYLGAFAGLWTGLCGGWLAGFFMDPRPQLSQWMGYGVTIGAGLLFVLGFIGGRVTFDADQDEPVTD